MKLVRIDREAKGLIKKLVLTINEKEYILSEKLGQLLVRTNDGKISVLPFLPCVANEVIIDTEGD